MINTLIYPYVRKKKDSLKRHIDVRGGMVWIGPPPSILAQKDLEVGDVLFCGSAEDGKATTLIQNLTDGSYVHCGVYIGEGMVADITRVGAREISFQSFYKDYSYLAVARCPGINQTRQRAIVRYAKLCVKKVVKYNWIGAALLPLNEYFYIKAQYSILFNQRYSPPRYSKKFITKYRMFCSEFIVQCYKASGYLMKRDPYTIPHKCSPTWLAESNIFELVGYMSSSGLTGVDDRDPFLGGCSYVLGKVKP